VVELEDGEEEMEGEGCVGFEFFVQRENYLVFADCLDFGAVKEASGDDVIDLSGSGTKNAREMDGLVSSKYGGL